MRQLPPSHDVMRFAFEIACLIWLASIVYVVVTTAISVRRLLAVLKENSPEKFESIGSPSGWWDLLSRDRDQERFSDLFEKRAFNSLDSSTSRTACARYERITCWRSGLLIATSAVVLGFVFLGEPFRN